MVILRFDSQDEERRALGWLAGRFSFKTWDNGDLMVHEAVLPYLAREGISFKVEDTQENKLFFRQFRERLRTRFRQVSIWMTSHPIDIE